MRIPDTAASAGFLLLCLLFAQALAVEPDGRGAPVAAKAVAARVGKGRVALDTVLAVWEPAHREIALRVELGEIPAEEANRRLQERWDEALETVIREEIFYQESMRDFETMIRKQVETIASRSRGSRGPPPNEKKIEREVRAHFRRQAETQVAAMAKRLVEASGGAQRLERSLETRGMTWIEWREGLRKKAFANLYLHNTLAPRLGGSVRPVDLRRFYKEHPEAFEIPGDVRFRHIFLSYEERGSEEAAREAAKRVFRDIRRGDLSFEEAARKESDDPLSRDDGGLETSETIPRGNRAAWMEDVVDAVREETPGAMGPVLVSPYGCHLVLPLEVGPARRIPFREAQRDIADRLLAARFEEETEALYRRLREEVYVEVLMPVFPSRYRISGAASAG